MKVLFVEDDLDLRDAMQSALETVSTVKELLLAGSLTDVEALPVKDCDLAILDVNLGVNQPSGLDVFHWLKKNGFSGDIVFLTGHGAYDPRVIAVSQLNSTEIYSKPLTLDKIVKLIEKLKQRRAK